MRDSSLYSAPIEINDESTIADICLLREKVWRDTGNLVPNAFGPNGWRDPVDSHCQHWIIIDRRETVVAAGRLSVHDRLADVHESHEYLKYGINLPGRYANPDRVVVDQSIAGHGLGRKILDAQDAAIRAENIGYSVRQASPAMVRLLLRRGWHVAGSATPDRRFPGVEFSVVIRASTNANGEVAEEFRDWLQQREAAA
jgi:GNAT superfamily N-acetyltransferase